MPSAHPALPRKVLTSPKCIFEAIVYAITNPSYRIVGGWSNSAAQQVGLIANTESRKTVSLNGQWQTIVDPYESGYYNYRYQPSDNGYFKNAKPKSKSDLIEYDFDSSATLNVPGDWNTQSDQLFFYEGTVWYKKSFDYQRKPDTRLFVYFGAANYLRRCLSQWREGRSA